MKKIFAGIMFMLFSPAGACYAAYNFGRPKTLDFKQQVADPLYNVLIDVVSFLPDLLVAFLIIGFGWVVAMLVKVILSRFLKSVGFDSFARKIGLSAVLEENKEKSITAHEWFSLAAFWLTMFISFITALNKLRLRIASAQLDHFLHFMMSIFSVVVIFVLGMFLSFVVSKIVKSVAQHTKVQNPEIWANITRGAVLVFTVIVCLIEVGLPSQIMLIAVSGIFISVCITFVMAFGIGGVGWAAKVLDRTLEKKD